jgi:hypothetical protein
MNMPLSHIAHQSCVSRSRRRAPGQQGDCAGASKPLGGAAAAMFDLDRSLDIEEDC